ncbi:DUF2497 domain-containing protein [Sphingomonas sp. SFZ2018-12]|uniref:DUF2497 domain-containing protein n=1 Tax=Sphingomonas sp. SFZ2018-12 TaxID=2683197 RepID=UPI003211D0CC
MMGDLGGETSMEDILSSIKRIIAEESDGTAGGTRGRKLPRGAGEPAPVAAPTNAADPDDAVLELSEEVHAPSPAARPAAPRPAPTKAGAGDSVNARRNGEAAAATAAPLPADAAAPAAATIVSDQAARATSRSLEALSRVIVAPQSPAGETLEDLVRDMLRPMLRDWLDANLPEMVEAMVAREIARIAGRNG